MLQGWCTSPLLSLNLSRIPGERFRDGHADGRFVTGIVGDEIITIAVVLVKKWEVVIVEYAMNGGDGVGSGPLGLSFKSSTLVYISTSPAIDTKQV